jgi:chromosome partitioning protein
MIRVIAIANQKGGCGKTTTTINLGACLARLNRRVLLVDLDPQAHTTVGLGILPERLNKTLYDLLCPGREGRVSWEEVVLELNPYLYLFPGDLRLNEFEAVFANHAHREKQLKSLFLFGLPSPVPFDFILLDCPPNLGLLTCNALEAAQEVIVPVEPSFFSLHGLAKISETLQRVADRRGISHSTNALLTLFDADDDFCQEVFQEVKKHFQDRLFHTIIHKDGLLREAASAGLNIADFEPASASYRDHMSLATEILEQGWRWDESPEAEKGEGFLRKIAGPRKVTGGVLFQCLAPGAREVFIAGDFNQWVGEALIRRNGNGLWQRVVPLPQGGYRYKFLIDGEWKLDPAAPQKLENPYGSFDSFVQVEADG